MRRFYVVSFFREIGNLVGLDWAKVALGYCTVNYNGEAVYIEGVKKIVSIADTEVIISVKDKNLKIVGEGLQISNLEEKTIVVRGEVFGVNEER